MKLKNMKTPLQLEPGRAKTLPAEKLDALWKDPQWMVQPKLDGWRFLMHFGGGLDRMYLTGRNVSVKTGEFSEKGLCLPYYTKFFDKALPSNMGYTVIDGEMMPPDDRHFRDLAGILNVEPAKAKERWQLIGKPKFVAFDMLFIDGSDLRQQPYLTRTQDGSDNRLTALETFLHGYDLPYTSLVENRFAHKESYYQAAVARGDEGVILKDSLQPYPTGSKTTWVKVKRYATLDVIVTGYTDAKEGKTGKFKGLLGAIVVSVYDGGLLREVGQVSGMTDELRVQISKNPKQYLGTVIEIGAQEFAKDRLRHPRFKRLRPEANPKSATFKKLMSDLKAAK